MSEIVIGQITVNIFEDSKRASIKKNYNAYNSDRIATLDEDDIYALEFAIQQIKRKLGL